jgi:UDP-N-acetylmuramate dehydrogenase
MPVADRTLPLDALRAAFGKRLREAHPLARYTSARIGGSAAALVVVQNADQLAEAARVLWDLGERFIILGGGSNVLVSDAGVHEVVILNEANAVTFSDFGVWAESGASLGVIARQAATKGLSGLEWAAGIPGSLGGALFGNAGAHGGDMAAALKMATILHQTDGVQEWGRAEMAYTYRSSALKREPGQAVILSAELNLEKKDPAEIRAQMDAFVAYRRMTQPPGASMGSMFKNPQGDAAGRLIEAAGLKGKRVGNAQISPLHGNFFLNLGEARAADVYALIQETRAAVLAHSGVELELEVELIGDWNQDS